MHFDSNAINNLKPRARALFVNSLTGFKSANLVATCDENRMSNLAIVSSAFHLGSMPPLLGMLIRPHSVPRHTLENILKTNYYTINHVHNDIFQQAHQTSARYPQGASEFTEVGLTELWQDGFPSPYVKESLIRLGMRLREHHHLTINSTELLVGEIIQVEIPDDILCEDGYIDIEKAGTVAVSSLDTYHTTSILQHMAYAKPFQSSVSVKRTTTEVKE